MKYHLDVRHIYATKLGEFAFVLDVDPKWIQNAAASLGKSIPYTVHSAQRLAATAVISETLILPALIAAKKAAERPRDHEHLIELEALLAMRR